MKSTITFFSSKDLLSLESMVHSTVLSGEPDSETPVVKASVLEVADMAKWAKSGEVIVTSGYALRGNDELLKQNIQELKEKEAVALCIKPGRFYGISADVVRYAKELHFMLIQLPLEAIFSNITREVADKVLERNTAAFNKEQQQTDALISLLIENPELESFIPKAEEIIDSQLLIFDDLGDLLISDKTRALIPTDVTEELIQRMFLPSDDDHFVIQHENVRYAFSQRRIKISEESAFCVLLLRFGSAPESPDILPLERVSKLLALEIKNNSALRLVRRQYEYKFVNDLLYGNFESDIDACTEAALFGYNFSVTKEYCVSAINIYGSDEPFRVNEIFIIQHLVHSFNNNMAVILQNSQMILLFERDPKEQYRIDLLNLSEKFHRIFRKGSISFCLSPPSLIRDISSAYNTVMRISAISRSCEIKTPFITYDQLGVLYVLSLLPDNQIVKGFRDKYLMPLKEYDKLHSGNLLTTLITYLNENCSTKNTAEKLFTHYNTIVYRLTKIQSLLDINIEDSEIQFQLRLALKLCILMPE